VTVALYATIGAKGLYLLFAWLLSAAIGATVADRKGYGERVGLTFGLLLTVVGLAIVLLLPSRPGSAWRIDGPFGRRRRPIVAGGPVLEAPTGDQPPAADHEPPAADHDAPDTARDRPDPDPDADAPPPLSA
jgi:hypothetical protein